jgi:hypothetical protein
MEAVDYTETSVTFQLAARSYHTEDRIVHDLWCDNLKPCIVPCLRMSRVPRTERVL